MSGSLHKTEIVFPVHNRKELTLQCLRSLARIDSDGLDVGVVVVDDGSTDGTSEAIRREFPEVEIVEGDGNLWFTEGTNVGIRAALKRDPEFVLLMNDDQVFDTKFLQYLVETAERHPRSVVGPLLLLWDQPHRLFQVSPVWDTMYGGWRHWDAQTVWTVPVKPWRVDLIVGNCVLVPAEAIRECGLMDSQRYPNFGDAEFTPRLKKRGWDLLIDPRSRVFCQPNTPPPAMRRMRVGPLINALFVDLKNNHNLRRRLYANLDGAPSRIHGIAAFGAFLGRLVFGVASRTRSRPRAEEPLSEMFASAVVPDNELGHN